MTGDPSMGTNPPNSKPTRRRTRQLGLACGFLLALLVSTHIPQTQMIELPQGIGLDKLLHVLAYGIGAALFFHALPAGSGWLGHVVVVFVLLAVAGLDEGTQPWVGRTASRLDWLADAVGITVAYFCFVGLKVRNHNQKRQSQRRIDKARLQASKRDVERLSAQEE